MVTAWPAGSRASRWNLNRKKPSGSQTFRPELSTEEKERETKRAGLKLAMAQTQSEMGAACRPAHREMLKLRLDAIRAQIEGL